MAVQSRCILPQELVDIIICDFRDDPTSLKACALVCHDWCSISQNVLFHTVKFDQETIQAFERSIKIMAEALSQKSLLINLVREISMHWFGNQGYNFFKGVTFTSLERITVKHIPWTQYRDEALRSTHKVFQLLTLKTIELFDTTFGEVKYFGMLFEECGKNTKTLRMHRVCFLEKVASDQKTLKPWLFVEEPEPTPPPQPDVKFIPENRPKLRTLEIVRGSASHLAEWLAGGKCPFDLSELKELRYEENHANTEFNPFVKLLKICSRSLEYLDIYAPSVSLGPHNLDIGTFTLPNLRSLTISGIRRHAIHTTIPWLTQLTQNSNICKLTFNFRLGSALVKARPEPTLEWKDLDNAVDNLPLTTLEEIEIKIPKLGKQTEDDVEKAYKRFWPQVAERSISRLTII